VRVSRQPPLACDLRLEATADPRAVEELTREAFWDVHVPGCDEHYLVHLMRDHADFVPALSLVAVLDGRLVGNIMTTRNRLRAGARELAALTVGPVTVHPDVQRRSIGRALIERVAELGRAQGYAAIVLQGHPHNYVGYGFRNARDLGIVAADGSSPFGLLALELTPGALAGETWTTHFSEVFDPPPGLEAFDATFPPRAKGWRPSQELFSMSIRARLG
jgi:putative acetyltransferase